jgi:hypothetical protein
MYYVVCAMLYVLSLAGGFWNFGTLEQWNPGTK